MDSRVEIDAKTESRIALFGGTFDPIHLGHTAVIAEAARQLDIQTLILIPAKRSPLKGSFPLVTDADRVTLIRLAMADHPDWHVSDCELKRPAPSYTIDTIRHFKTRYGDHASLYWLIGADAVSELPHWHCIDQLLDLCQIVAMVRAGCPKPDFSPFIPLWGQDRARQLQKHIIETPLVDISSTQIRQRLAMGQDVSGMLCPAVQEYIHRRHLYR